MNTLKRFCLILSVCAILLGETGCKVGLDGETQKVLENAIKAFQPSAWENSLSNLIDQLHNVGYDLADQIADDIRSLMIDASNQIKGVMGFGENTAFCTVEFLGSRIELKLRILAHNYYPKKFPEVQYSPVICNVVPGSVSSSYSGIVTFFGFDFLNYSGNYLVQIRQELVDAPVKENIAEFVRKSNYEATINLQPSDFSALDHNKKYIVEVTWNDINITNQNPNQAKSGLSILWAAEPVLVATMPPALPPLVPMLYAPPGLVMLLYHSDMNPFPPITYDTNTLSKLKVPVPVLKRGGDLGSDPGHGLEWWIVPGYGNTKFQDWKLPQGVVFGLKHSSNQGGDAEINVFGANSVDGNDANDLAPCFRRVTGGDNHGSSGEGFYWFISTGSCFDAQNDQRYADQLPYGTVVGLRNSINNANDEATLVHWGADVYDSLQEQAPPGYIRVCGPDHPWVFGQAPVFCWFMKTTGLSIVYYDAASNHTVGHDQHDFVDLPRNNLDKILFPPEGSPDVCQAYCYGKATCAAWTYVKPGIRGPNSPAECWLKAPVPSPKGDKCCISGLK